MIDKNKMPVAIGVAFVWFTTQFGGGFASGAQLLSYFIKFGIWALLTFGIAQFGLIPLVNKGYGYLGYLTIVVIVIPFIIRMVGEAMGKIKK